jgi:hypothetical protein
MKGLGAAIAFGLIVPAAGARAAELKIVDIKAYVFLEHAGRLSEDLVGAPALVDAPRGGAPDGDTATGVMLDFTFQGDKSFSPKYATATVDVTQTNHAGQQVVTHKAFTGFVFGADGLEHKALFLENATCAPLAIDVHAGRTQKQARLDFSCAAIQAAN